MKGDQITVTAVLVKCSLCDSIHKVAGLYNLMADAVEAQLSLERTLGKDFFVEVEDIKVEGLVSA
jgi:hypothetical protein